MSVLKSLEDWYKNNSNNEFSCGIQIETTESFGWYVTIDLFNTIYENRKFESIEIMVNEENWLICYIRNNLFEGYGGAQNLEDILQIFYKWVSNKQ